MRKALPLFAAALVLAGCGKGSSQADQLDNAAAQSDPAAANELRNEADAIRENGSDANVSDPGSPAQEALQNAGNAAAADPNPPVAKKKIDPETGLKQ